MPMREDTEEGNRDQMQMREDTEEESRDQMPMREDTEEENRDQIPMRETAEEGGSDFAYMREALALAGKAAEGGDVPIGCVIVHDGKVIGRGYNRRNVDHSVLAHAELLAIREATGVIGDWRLEDCTMYVTLEPCQMCAGAIVQARIPKVVIGAMNPKAGCAGSVLNLLQLQAFNHQAEVTTGLLEEEASKQLKNFFARLRQEKGTSGNKVILE